MGDDPDVEQLRRRLTAGEARTEVRPLTTAHLPAVAWSGRSTHLESIRRELVERVPTGDVEYLALFVDGHPLSKGGIDYAKEPGSATIWQLATHPQLEGVGLATTLIGAMEEAAGRRGVTRLRIAVEPDNDRARRLYEHLGYATIGESEASWQAERPDGSRFLYTTKLVEMEKRT